MFNLSLAFQVAMLQKEFSSKEQFLRYAESAAEYKNELSTSKIVFLFKDTSSLCFDGNDIKARPPGFNILELLQ